MKSPWATSSTTSSVAVGGRDVLGDGGDYDFDAAKNEYVMGSTLTSLAYDKFSKADKAALKQNDLPAPAAQLDIGVSLSGFKGRDSNYPINPTLKLTTSRPRPYRAAPASSSWSPPPPQTPSPTRAAWG